MPLNLQNDKMSHAQPAQRLMAIARDPRLTNPTHASLLPQSWMTLFELTRLSDDQFATAIADGLIQPDMHRSDLETLRRASVTIVDKAATAPTSYYGSASRDNVIPYVGPKQNEIIPPDPAPSPSAKYQPEPLTELARPGQAKNAVNALRDLGNNAACGADAFFKELQSQPNNPTTGRQLDLVYRGLVFAIELKDRLDQARRRGEFAELAQGQKRVH
jgi:hypothetical protein